MRYIGKIVEVLGPTGVGKSRLAVTLAKTFGGEVVSADSMQVYRGFDIGADKITAVQMEGIPHHGIDILDAHEQYNAFRFLHNAWNWSCDIWKRDCLPIFCGGTALYLRVLQQGVFEEKCVGSDLRNFLRKRYAQEGNESLWNELWKIDPKYAEKIGQNDEKRIIRGLEIVHNTGMPPSKAFLQNKTPFRGSRFIRIGLNTDRGELYRRIEARVERMIASGLVAETRILREQYPRSAPPFSGVGYREICDHLEGLITLEEAVTLIKQHSRNYAKRQLSWWRQEKDIIWFEPDQVDEITRLVGRELCP